MVFGLHFEIEALLTPGIHTRQRQLIHVGDGMVVAAQHRGGSLSFFCSPTLPSLAFLLIITLSAFPFSTVPFPCFCIFHYESWRKKWVAEENASASLILIF